MTTLSPHLSPSDRAAHPPGETPRDYVLRPYAPHVAPEGRAHSVSLLRWFLRETDQECIWPVVERCRAYLGAGETVWGFKTTATGQTGVELYFYRDQGGADPLRKSATSLVGVLADLLHIDTQFDESLPYVMCSLELTRDTLATRRSPGFRIYTPGNRARIGHDGTSYLATGRSLIRENTYYFYNTDTELPLVTEQVRHSARAGGDERLLPRGLTRCFSICFANKQQSDALYFSRVTTAQTIVALRTLWPSVSACLQENRADFAHLCWDIGYDFSAPANHLRAPTIQKVGIYGYC